MKFLMEKSLTLTKASFVAMLFMLIGLVIIQFLK